MSYIGQTRLALKLTNNEHQIYVTNQKRLKFKILDNEPTSVLFKASLLSKSSRTLNFFVRLFRIIYRNFAMNHCSTDLVYSLTLVKIG